MQSCATASPANNAATARLQEKLKKTKTTMVRNKSSGAGNLSKK